jgi:hypothetical protein
MERFYLQGLVIITVLLTASCSAIEFAYNNAPSFVASEVEDAFDLDGDQVTQLEDGLQQFFIWHRQQELPRYRQFLETAASAISDGITADEFLELSAELRLAWQRSLARAIDDLGELALTLTPAQIDHYQQYFLDDSGEYDDYLQMSAQQREIFRVNRSMKRLQRWFGKLDNTQQKKISQRLQQLPDFYPAWINYREARQQALLEALRVASVKGISPEQLKFILIDPTSSYAKVFEQERSAYWRAYAEFIEDISGLLSQSQLQHAVERLQDYADAVNDLVTDN